ncbi:MAG: hypothetical protein EA351_10270 [Gemmatimonadales bacterium]|nr:MAG: hypothetical protein EA351_10270 [Gemmatimonadales bacterium]
MTDETRRWIRIAGISVVAVAAAGAVAALIVRDQMNRQQRNLFHPSALRRMGALGHISRQRASVDLLNLLRDYIAWESRKLLRNRARAVVDRMEREIVALEDTRPRAAR